MLHGVGVGYQETGAAAPARTDRINNTRATPEGMDVLETAENVMALTHQIAAG